MTLETPISDVEGGREMTIISIERPEDILENVWRLRMVTGFQLKIIYEFLCSYQLSNDLEANDLHELITAADFLMLPSVIVAARERLKKIV